MGIESHDEGFLKVRIDSEGLEVGLGFSETLNDITGAIESLSESIVALEQRVGKEKRDVTREEKKDLRDSISSLREKIERAQRRFGDMKEFTRQDVGDRIKDLVTIATGKYIQGNGVLMDVLDFLKVDWTLPNQDLEEFVKSKKEDLSREAGE